MLQSHSIIKQIVLFHTCSPGDPEVRCVDKGESGRKGQALILLKAVPALLPQGNRIKGLAHKRVVFLLYKNQISLALKEVRLVFSIATKLKKPRKSH